MMALACSVLCRAPEVHIVSSNGPVEEETTASMLRRSDLSILGRKNLKAASEEHLNERKVLSNNQQVKLDITQRKS